MFFQMLICDALRYLVPFVQFKNRGCFSRFLKLYKRYQIAQLITYVLRLHVAKTRVAVGSLLI